MITSKTPLRMSVVGGGSDLPSYYEYAGGAVLSTTINKFIYINVNKKFDDNIRVSYSITELVDRVKKLKHPIVRNVLTQMGIERGIEITSISDIPSTGTGLGSSSSFTVGLLNALHTYNGGMISKEDLAQLACHIELNLCAETIGKQDQYAAAYGGINLIEFNIDGSVNVIPLGLSQTTISKINESLLCFYTGKSRSANEILIGQSDVMGQKEKRKIIDKMVSFTYKLKKALECDDLESFGEILDLNWKFKRQLTSRISDFEIDEWYSRGIKAGAYGGKILGAGGGGFLMFFAPKENHPVIIEQLSQLKRVDFATVNEASSIVYNSFSKEL
jgi:D-glycero-alpha-D-manno-heptose-7-phosphate kinase